MRSSVSVCCEKKSGVTVLPVISQAVALAPFSQNSKGCGFAGLAQEQLTHMKPSGLVLLKQNFTAENGDLFLGQDMNHGIERSPTAGRRVVFLDLCFWPHGGILSDDECEGKPVATPQVPPHSEPCARLRVDTSS